MEKVTIAAKAGDTFVSIVVDTEIAERLRGRKLSIGSHGYAQTFWDGHVTVLHRWILGLRVGDKRIGDHINGDKLDNRMANLRIVDASGSSQNVAGRGFSSFRGVHPTKSGRWSARVKYRGKHYILGTFDTEHAAAEAAEAKRIELMPHYVPMADRVR